MKRLVAPIAVAVLCLAAPSRPSAKDCSRTSTGLVPIVDLGTGTHGGFEGGLYSGGSNARPPAHDAAGVAIASAIVPLDAAGAPDPVSGRIVLLSIGMSNTTQEFSTFVPLANAEPAKNPRVLLVDGAQGGQDAPTIANPSAAFWTNVDARLAAAGATGAQVQVAWIKEAVAGPSLPFPGHADELRGYLETICGILHDRFPNLRLAFLSSRTYAGYADTALNPEPFAYESGFSVKWLIEDQIAGEPSLNYDAGAGAVESPWLSWGPYLWTDGLAGRSDGLVWTCDDTQDDGTHPSIAGREKVASLLLDFFLTDAAAAPWFRAGGAPPAFPAESEPNDDDATATATADGFTIAGTIASAADEDWFAFDALAGETVTCRARTPGSGIDVSLEIVGPDGSSVLASDADDDDGTDAMACAAIAASGRHFARVTGAAPPAGAYTLALEKGGATAAESEPNDSRASADPLAADDVVSGAIDPGPDADFFRFVATPGSGFEIDMVTCDGPAPAGRDAQMRLLNATGAALMTDEDSGPDADPRLSGVLPASAGGVYFAQLRARSGLGHPDFLYRLRLRVANAVFDATPIEAGPRFGPLDAPRVRIDARNVTPDPQGALTFTIVAEAIDGGGAPVEIFRKRREASVPGAWTYGKTLRLRTLPDAPGRYRLTLALAQDSGLAWTRRIEVERTP